MEHFRTTTSLPEWSKYGRDGYLSPDRRRSRRTRVSSEGPSSSQPRPRLPPVPPLAQRKLSVLPRDLKRAEYQTKLSRLVQSMWLAVGWQLILLLVFSCVFVRNYKVDSISAWMTYLGYNYIFYVVNTLVSSALSIFGVLLVSVVYLTLFMEATCLNSTEQFAESLLEQLKRYATLRFLFKPICFGFLAWAHCFIFLQLFDTNYASMFTMKEETSGFVHENLLVVRLASFFAGFEFFANGFVHRRFRLQFPSTQVKWTPSSLLRIDVLLENAWGSFRLASLIWILCLLFGTLSYSSVFAVFGIEFFESQIVHRIILFLDVGFIIRVFLWVYIPRLTLCLYLRLVNSYFTEVINFPIEYPSNNKECLLMSEAMKSPNSYLKFQAFYEFKLKAHVGNPDVMMFFNLTHPGNHPMNWKGVVSASCDALSEMNNNVIKFLQTAKLPPTLLTAGFQPYVLEKLSNVKKPEAPAVPAGINRTSNMRDLASVNPPHVPHHSPAVFDRIKETLTALWNDVQDSCRGLLTMQHISNLIFFGKLESKLPDKQIANILSAGALSLWAMEGTLELICISVKQDSRGIVHQDLQCYIKKIVETFDTLCVLEFYMLNILECEMNMDMDNSLLEESKHFVSKMITTTMFVLAKLHPLFSDCYNILNVDPDCQRRAEEIFMRRGQPV